ncbi:coatomer subunit gamma-2 isoform 1 [Tropilaelaps mercedesae]|uniref:Coatomer subunit gamma n=1 Tax=Tropilaelaps mercedesae TaxID=418985 RepID=A0A1V9XBP2_9ACAR|nr:coatomer subunit gamma-2 isoform 1 [Tropilaelaps mercedesae]
MHSRKDKKDDEDGGISGTKWAGERSSVLQEARVFTKSPVDPKKSSQVLTKLLYLLNQGEKLSAAEATDTFFAMTRLFQSQDTMLRRLVYLGIKELASTANDVIIVTSSLTKDMTGKEQLYRAAAIRALCKIADAGTLQAVERYMKQAIVDKNGSVASGALVSCIHLLNQGCADIVRRWPNEVQEALNSDDPMVQYHALGLLYQMRQNDKLAVSKLISKYTKYNVKSPYALCMLIKLTCKLIQDEGYGTDSPMFGFVESCLRHKNDMVVYEAAHCIVNMRSSSPSEVSSAVSVLQLFLSSPKPMLRFAAVRTLNRVAISHPSTVMGCNMDLEQLISDSNRSIATLAITTLLKTAANESSVERLMKQISTFMSEISDEFKVVVVESIQSLCEKFPSKQGTMMTFLANMLRDDGGFDYKKAIVDTITDVINNNEESMEIGLGHLCEFIEDCEHTSLAVKILSLLATRGPHTPNPAKYVRFIYNRLILENAQVRAAAVSALAQFGTQCSGLVNNVIVLLERSLLDEDDEVRDRAAYYLQILQQGTSDVLQELTVSITGLEKALCNYLKSDMEMPFDLSQVKYEPPAKQAKTAASTTVPEKKLTPGKNVHQEEMLRVPQFAMLEVSVASVAMNPDWKAVLQVPLERLAYQETGSCFMCYEIPEEPEAACNATFQNTLKFTVKDCDPATGEPDDAEGYPDEYSLEEVELGLADHVLKVANVDFSGSWDEMGPESELEDTFVLTSYSSLSQAIHNIQGFLGMHACERSDQVPEGKATHTLLLAGVFRGGEKILVRSRLALSEGKEGVTMNMVVRSTDPTIPELILTSVG